MELMPIQTAQQGRRGAGKLGRDIYMLAYEVYSAVYGSQEALIEDGCRGGFSTGEVIAFLYARNFPKAEWPKRVDEAFTNMENL